MLIFKAKLKCDRCDATTDCEAQASADDGIVKIDPDSKPDGWTIKYEQGFYSGSDAYLHLCPKHK